MSKLAPPNPREPWLDPRTGMVSMYWLRFLNDLHTRVGGQVSRTLVEVQVDMPDDAGVAELARQLIDLENSPGQAPLMVPPLPDNAVSPVCQYLPAEDYLETQVRALTEHVALLTKQIEELKQGTAP